MAKKSPLTAITNRAKALRRSHPGKKWTDLIKQAARELRGKKKPAAKKKRARVSAVKYVEKNETRNTKPSKVYRTVRSKKGTFKGYKRLAGATVQSHLTAAGHILLEELGRLSARKLVAKTKRDAKKLQKVITVKRAQYKRLFKKV